jgi:hypothetical protein
VLFCPSEDFIDLGPVEYEAVRGANIADGFVVYRGCISGRFLSSLFQGEYTAFSVVCCTSVAPEGHGKLPDAINGGSHPAVRGEGVTGFPGVVVVAYGIFSSVRDAAAKKLVPSDPALRVEGRGDRFHNRFGGGSPSWGCNVCAVDPAVHTVT